MYCLPIFVYGAIPASTLIFLPVFFEYMSRSHCKCTKYVAASKLYKNKLVIPNGASFYVSMSPRLPS